MISTEEPFKDTLHAMCNNTFILSSYGDRRPTTFGGKIFAVIWTLTGQVVVLILTSLVAGHLTTYSLKIDQSLYGKEVSILVIVFH